MKKTGFLIISILIFSLILNLANAQDTDTGVPEDIEKITKGAETAKEKYQTQNTSYLLQEWRNILLKNPFGKILVKIWDFIKIPLTIITGTQAEISWKFAIAIGLWIALLWLVANTFIAVSPFSKGVSWIIGLGIVIIISATKQIDKFAGFLDNLIGKWWGKVIIFIVIIALIISSSVISKKVKKTKEKEQIEEDKRKLHAAAKESESFTEGAGI